MRDDSTMDDSWTLKEKDKDPELTVNPNRERFTYVRWWRLYYVLAAFDIATILFSLYLNDRLIRTFDHSVVVNQNWAERLSEISDLGLIAARVNAPGNDIFDTRDVDRESLRLQGAQRRFEERLDWVESRLMGKADSFHDHRIKADLQDIRASMGEMITAAQVIFQCFREHQPEKAGIQMAEMDRKFSDLNMGLAQLGRHIRDFQTENLRAQQFESSVLSQFESLIGVAVVVMVLAVAIYGFRMTRAMTALTKERESHLFALQEARSGLERKVEARTSELREEIRQRALAQQAAQEAQAQLVRASHQAGMAEVATSVLHNVGNVLNSVNISTSTVYERLEKSRLSLLRKSVALLDAHSQDLATYLTQDPKGKAFAGWLAKLTDALEEEQSALKKEMNGVMQHVEHIKQIISMQQDSGRSSGLLERLDPRLMIEDAIRLGGGSAGGTAITLKTEVQTDRWIVADRHKVLQILVNLIRNAEQAVMAMSELADRRVLITVREIAADRLSVSVSDNGIGIHPEIMAKLFHHGFTTKPNGHGFGLHSAILAARDMKGDLSASSEGPGKGAVFTLELPSVASALMRLGGASSSAADSLPNSSASVSMPSSGNAGIEAVSPRTSSPSSSAMSP